MVKMRIFSVLLIWLLFPAYGERPIDLLNSNYYTVPEGTEVIEVNKQVKGHPRIYWLTKNIYKNKHFDVYMLNTPYSMSADHSYMIDAMGWGDAYASLVDDPQLAIFFKDLPLRSKKDSRLFDRLVTFERNNKFLVIIFYDLSQENVEQEALITNEVVNPNIHLYKQKDLEQITSSFNLLKEFPILSIAGTLKFYGVNLGEEITDKKIEQDNATYHIYDYAYIKDKNKDYKATKILTRFIITDYNKESKMPIGALEENLDALYHAFLNMDGEGTIYEQRDGWPLFMGEGENFRRITYIGRKMSDITAYSGEDMPSGQFLRNYTYFYLIDNIVITLMVNIYLDDESKERPDINIYQALSFLEYAIQSLERSDKDL